MKIWQALILGLVQGLAEFLPVSSSGHLVLVRELMGISGNYIMFDMLLHTATAAGMPKYQSICFLAELHRVS